jgi:hypothetical protein
MVFVEPYFLDGWLLTGYAMDDEVTRRTYLEALLATGVVAGTAGCSSSQNNSTTSTTDRTPTATPNQAPQILAHDATPQDTGTSLAVHLEGQDDHGLSLARIEYGSNAIEKSPNATGVTIDDEFTNVGTTELDEASGRITYLLRDTDGKETRATARPDETAPELLAFSATPTENAGELSLVLEGRDDVGLEAIQLRLGESPRLQKDASGRQEVSISQPINVPDDAAFQQHTVTASLEDWNGNTTETEAETYVRKYDVMEDTRLDVGAVYIPWAGDKFGKCLDAAHPSIGQYSYPTAPEVRSKHFDQMQGHGITNVLFNFNGTDDDRRSAKRYLESNLADQVRVRPKYSIKDYRWNPGEQGQSWKKWVVPRDMKFIQKQFLSHENAFTYNDRPVINIWNADYWGWESDYRERIKQEWGSFESFVTDLRSHLQVEGKDPFIIGGVSAGRGYWGFDESAPLLKEFDATTTWTNTWALAEEELDTNQANWSNLMPYIEANFKGHRKFTETHDMEFIPMVFPGFDDRLNTCWGQDRYIPRSQEQFKDLLELADEYRTTNMIDIATWNDWTEGTQIEPGSFRDTDYGTEYLKIVQEFQKPA